MSARAIHGMNKINYVQSWLDLCYLLHRHKCKNFGNILECSVNKLKICNKKTSIVIEVHKGRRHFNMQNFQYKTNHQLLSITIILTRSSTQLKSSQNKIYLVQSILKSRDKVFVTAILFDGTEPERTEILVFVYACNCSHQWTHDNFCVVHKVNLQLNKHRNVIILRDFRS